MRIDKRQNGYDIRVEEDHGRSLVSALARAFEDQVRFTGGFWVANYGTDQYKNDALDRAIKRAQKAWEKEYTDAILRAPKVLGEIKPLPELDVEIPVRRPLYGYQAPGVAYCLEHPHTIIGDQPGLGKTTIASATLLAGRLDSRFRMLPALIVCPTTIKRKWQRELMEVSGLRALILNDKYKNSWPRYIQAGLVDAVIVNFESLKKFFVQLIAVKTGEDFRLSDVVFRPEIGLFKTVIIDEIHKAKDYKTQTAKFLKGITDGKPNIYGLTGTMLVNKPDDLIAQLSIIGELGKFGGLRKFKARYCTTRETWDAVKGEKVKQYPNLDELNFLLTERCFFRREKKDVLKDLPDKTRQIITVDITNRAEYDKAETKFEEYLKTIKNCDDFAIARKMRAMALVQMGVLCEISARGKMQAIKEWGDNLIESGEKIVLFSELQDVIDKTKAMWPGTLEISGRVTGDNRDRAVRLFQESAVEHHPAITCNIKAGGVGIDLFRSSNVGFVMLPWHNADLEQCEDRCHRNGQKNAVLSGLFIGADTIDEYRWGKIQEKRAIAKVVHGAADELAEEAIDGLLDFFRRRKQKTQQTANALNF